MSIDIITPVPSTSLHQYPAHHYTSTQHIITPVRSTSLHKHPAHHYTSTQHIITPYATHHYTSTQHIIKPVPSISLHQYPALIFITCCSYKKDKRTKSENLPKSNYLSEKRSIGQKITINYSLSFPRSHSTNCALDNTECSLFHAITFESLQPKA